MEPTRSFPLSSYETWLIVRGLQLLEERYDQQPKRARIERLRRLVAGVQVLQFVPFGRSTFSDDTASAAEKRDQGPQPPEAADAVA